MSWSDGALGPFVAQQCLLLPLSLLFYHLGSRARLDLTQRYLFVAAGGCILAVATMGIYSTLVFASAFVCVLLMCRADPRSVHARVFWVQMLWQTFWHLYLRFWEYHHQEPASVRLFLAVSSLMLLTQRVTSVSLDLQEGRVVLASDASSRDGLPVALPLVSYALSFTTLLGGPLCSYGRFVSFMEGISGSPPPSPLGAVAVKMAQVLALQQIGECLVYVLKRSGGARQDSGGALWFWGLALLFRIRYYAHWRISECLNNAAGLGFREGKWSGMSDGDVWTTETSSRVSQFARRWNRTTASWLRRLVYERSARRPLLLTFGLSLWWHGLHAGHFAGFLTLAAAVKADRHLHGLIRPALRWKRAEAPLVCLSWFNTQMILTCVVIAVELRDASALRLLSGSYVTLFPLLNVSAFLTLLAAEAVYRSFR